MTVFDPYTAQQAAEAQAPKRAETAKQMFEREKAAVTCYEENWDDWDGPIWPKGTVQCVLSTCFPSRGSASPFHAAPCAICPFRMQLKMLWGQS
jgi:hypothetical protein